MTSSLPSHWFLLPLVTETLAPATHTNTMLIGADDFAVVDPGASDPAEQARLCAALDARFKKGDRLAAIVLTHQHPDHTSGVDALLAWLGERDRSAPLMAHAETFRRLTFEQSAIKVSLRDEAEIVLGQHVLQVVFTPGHAPGHLALWDKQAGVVYGGDMVASEGTIVVSPPDGDMTDYMASLERLRSLDAAVLVPSHGAPIYDVHARIDTYLAHRTMRETLVWKALGEHPRSLTELVPAAYPALDPAYYPLAEHSLLAHLLKLEKEGRAGHGERGWRVR